MITKKEQIEQLTLLKGTKKLLQHNNRHGFIYFNENSWVVFIELHSGAVTLNAIPFKDAINNLLDASFKIIIGGEPKYEFEKIWIEPYTYDLSEIKEHLISNL